MLEIEDLVAGYGGVAVLRDVSVKLAAGELSGCSAPTMLARPR